MTPWTVARQAPLSMGFSRQEYCRGLPCPPPGDLPNSGIEPMSLASPALAGGFFTMSATWVARITILRVNLTCASTRISKCTVTLKQGSCGAPGQGSLSFLNFIKFCTLWLHWVFTACMDSSLDKRGLTSCGSGLVAP